ncbi:MAG: hypothetical protein K2K57_00320 [Oscillospiraceae bacterium]|nr:hypothetical protein [Oscillospiraceae bacterium]
MKKSKVLSALMAAIMITGMAAAASAADYGTDPGYTAPIVPSSVGRPIDPAAAAVVRQDSTDNSSVTVANDTVTKTVTNRAVTVALEKGVPIKISSAVAAVKSNALAQLAKKGEGVLKFTANRFTAEIESSSVIDAKNIDIGLAITKNTDRRALILKTRQKGEYGCTVKYSIPAKIYTQAGVDLAYAAVYQVNRRTGIAEFYAPLELDADGNIVFEVYEGGNYIIL